jgi:hypothetical protein
MDGVSIADAAWQVTVSPAWGFVLTEAVDVPSGAQMLWRRPGSGQGPPPEELGPPGDASIDTFHDLFLGGWFVMFPNAGFPDDDRDRFIHGEATRLPWEVVEQTPTAVAARMTTPRTGFEIARRVELLDGDLVISTEVTNVGDAPTEYTYGEHPCVAFATFAGGRIGIEAGDAWVPAPPYDPGCRS